MIPADDSKQTKAAGKISCIIQGYLHNDIMTDEQAVASLAALAHVDRLAAFRMLVKAGPDGVPSGVIAEALTIPPTRMSFHLATLERSGLISSRRDGRRILYAASYDDMRGLLGFITEDCCGGNLAICGDLASLASPSCISENC